MVASITDRGTNLQVLYPEKIHSKNDIRSFNCTYVLALSVVPQYEDNSLPVDREVIVLRGDVYGTRSAVKSLHSTSTFKWYAAIS